MIKTCSYGAKNVVNFTTETNRQRFIGQNWQFEMLNYAQNSSRFEDGNNPMISVVYHLPRIPWNSGWDVNGKRFFWFVPLKNSRDKLKFCKGSHVFPTGTFRMEIRLPCTSFLSHVVTRIQSSAARQSGNFRQMVTTRTVLTDRKFPTKLSGFFL